MKDDESETQLLEIGPQKWPESREPQVPRPGELVMLRICHTNDMMEQPETTFWIVQRVEWSVYRSPSSASMTAFVYVKERQR